VRAVLVRGANDVASAVAHRLFTAGYAVVLHEEAEPTAARRGMAFADAVFDGSAELEGVTAVRVDGPASAVRLLRDREAVPLAVGDLAALVAAVRPHVLVDAWMRKRAVPEDQRGLAPLVVGLGPNFVAGGNVDLAVETSWADLGRLVEHGPTLPLAGEPRPIAGVGRERYVYAPRAGLFRTARKVGDPVRAGDAVAAIGDETVEAPIDGVLRGLTRDGVRVAAGTKVVEVDPRGAEGAALRGIGERPGRIADAVLHAIRAFEASRRQSLVNPDRGTN
jgi:xanthine dehydrogenase accessory factor